MKILALLIVLLPCVHLRAAAPPDREQAAELAKQAFIYGYPLVLMDVTMRKMTAPPAPGEENLVNRFSHIRAFPDPSVTDVVSLNADTLYSIAWLDLKASPAALRLPDTGDRYYVMQIMDAWTNVFASLGSRTTGNRAGTYLITGPDWRGTVPENMVRVPSPTNMVWILGRTQTNGKEDYEAVRAIQDRYTLLPLADAPPEPVEPIVIPASPPEIVAAMDASRFFAELNRLMKDNPPAPADRDFIAGLAAVSVGPGLPFDPAAMPPGTAEAIEKGRLAGLDSLAIHDGRQFGAVSNGWSVIPANVGDFGTDYYFRALIARYGLGANLPADAVYPSIRVDSDGLPLNGGNRYAIRFAPGQTPPVKAFWSISMYDDRQRFIENPIDRYAIGDRDPLSRDADGGLTVYLRHDLPDAEKQANWLPAPRGDFNLIMRLYWPDAAVLDGTWPLPRLQRIN